MLRIKNTDEEKATTISNRKIDDEVYKRRDYSWEDNLMRYWTKEQRDQYYVSIYNREEKQIIDLIESQLRAFPDLASKKNLVGYHLPFTTNGKKLFAWKLFDCTNYHNQSYTSKGFWVYADHEVNRRTLICRDCFYIAPDHRYLSSNRIGDGETTWKDLLLASYMAHELVHAIREYSSHHGNDFFRKRIDSFCIGVYHVEQNCTVVKRFFQDVLSDSGNTIFETG